MSSFPKRVLVADSDEIVLALISHILHRQGYRADVALTAADAAAQLRKDRYDAIVLDAKLSAVLGEFQDHHVRTILLGSPDSSLKPFAVLPKPVEFGSLVETVAACVK